MPSDTPSLQVPARESQEKNLNVRTKLISTAVVVPVIMTAPAMAEAPTPTPEPTITEPAPIPNPTDTIAPTTEPAPTESIDPAPSQTPDPAASFGAIPVEPPAPTRKRSVKRTSRAGVSLRTKGTRYSPMTAVFRLMQWARQGRAGYRNGCLRLVDDAYGIQSGRTSTALRQWYRARKAGYGHTNRLAPIGAQLFWRTSNPAGHIATYVGRGLVVTNMPSGRVKIVTWSSVDRWGPYLGWAEPYYR